MARPGTAVSIRPSGHNLLEELRLRAADQVISLERYAGTA